MKTGETNMRTLDKVLAPLRASRAALVPYVENIQSGYHDAENFARSKAHALVRQPPQAVRLFANRYVLISLAAGFCVFAASRLRRWRNNGHARRAAPRARPAASRSSAPRKNARAATRATRVH
jgi:hypothetical protein